MILIKLECFFTVIMPDYPRNSLGNSLANYMKWTAITAHDNQCCVDGSAIMVHHQKALANIYNDKHIVVFGVQAYIRSFLLLIYAHHSCMATLQSTLMHAW